MHHFSPVLLLLARLVLTCHNQSHSASKAFSLQSRHLNSAQLPSQKPGCTIPVQHVHVCTSTTSMITPAQTPKQLVQPPLQLLLANNDSAQLSWQSQSKDNLKCVCMLHGPHGHFYLGADSEQYKHFEALHIIVVPPEASCSKGMIHLYVP